MVYYLFWTAYTMRVDPQDFSDFFGRSLRESYRFELWLAQRSAGLWRKQLPIA